MTTDYQVGSRVTCDGRSATVVGLGWSIYDEHETAVFVRYDGDQVARLRAIADCSPLVEPLPYGPVPRGERDEVQSRLYAASAALADAFAHVVKARRPECTPQQRKACLVQAASEIAYVLRNAADAACALATEFVEKAV